MTRIVANLFKAFIYLSLINEQIILAQVISLHSECLWN